MRSYPPRELYRATAATLAKIPLLFALSLFLSCSLAVFVLFYSTLHRLIFARRRQPHNPSCSDKIARYATRDRTIEKVSWEGLDTLFCICIYIHDDTGKFIVSDKNESAKLSFKSRPLRLTNWQSTDSKCIIPLDSLHEKKCLFTITSWILTLHSHCQYNLALISLVFYFFLLYVNFAVKKFFYTILSRLILLRES